MRGGRLHILAFGVCLLSACSGSPAPLDPPPPLPAPPPSPPPAEIPSVYRFPEEGAAIRGGAVHARAEAAPKPAPGPEDLIRLQKETVERDPTRDDERLKLALLQAAAGDVEAAERTLSGLRVRSHPIVPYLELFLRRQLGDHQEAGKLLGLFVQEDRRVTGFMIENAQLCSRIRRFREYTPAENDRVRAGGTALIYVEPRNFTLGKEQDRHVLHLRYEWKLYDDRSVEVPVPAWEAAPPSDREDRIVLNGPVQEFYQYFKLPLPADLAPGAYRIKVSATDVASGKSDRIYIPITVTGKDR